jgi:hypothetical protein
MLNNTGLCGDLVSVGSVGTSYTGGIGGTNLGNCCNCLEARSEYQTCLASPSSCGQLYATHLNAPLTSETIPTRWKRAAGKLTTKPRRVSP